LKAVKVRYSIPNAKFVASQVSFRKFNASAYFHNAKVSGETDSAHTKAAEIYPGVLRKMIDKDGYTTEQILIMSINVGCSGRKCGIEHTF
jgi:hypothetical protein